MPNYVDFPFGFWRHMHASKSTFDNSQTNRLPSKNKKLNLSEKSQGKDCKDYAAGRLHAALHSGGETLSMM